MKTNRLIHAGFWFGRSDIKEAIELAKAGVGGFCIYFGTKKDVKHLTETLQSYAPHQLLFSADYEYGLGRWLPDAETLPSNISLGASQSEELSQKKGYLTACQAKELGVRWILTPDLDLADTPSNPIVNTRSFGADPALVSKLAKAYMRGLAEGGCLNSIKHFPGHGATKVDSHLELPVINKTLKEMEEHELIPFKELYTDADSIMIAHLKIPSVDRDNPASFSAKFIKEYIRGYWRYKGCIVTDALVMKATGGLNPADAFRAGADILLCPDDPLSLLQSFEKTVKEDPSLIDHAIDAISHQEKMLNKLNTLLTLPCKDAFCKNDLSLNTARAAIALKGNLPSLKSGDSVHYMEVESNNKNFKASALLDSLKENGIKVVPYNDNEKVKYLLAATFSNYAAFSGQINFTAEQKTRLNEAVKKADSSVLISFGSPFVDMDISGLNAFLMAGTHTEPFQITAADILLGKHIACGKMPV